MVSDVPTTHETALDMTFIQHFLAAAAPRLFPSGWTVDFHAHYLGGGRHWAEWPGGVRRWEIADIGFLVLFRRGGQLVRSKVALLQSKRLYPDELEWDEDSPLDYMRGFGRLMQHDDGWAYITEPRTFSFAADSRYKALITAIGQYEAIQNYEAQRQVPVYYLLYNPLKIPSQITLPLMPGQDRVNVECSVGCRVVPAQRVRLVLDPRPPGSVPTYVDLRSLIDEPVGGADVAGGWRLEDFVDRLLDCEVGYVADSPQDAGLNYIFNRRSGPITAALSLTIDAPA
jgi:hypothetical protein